MTISSTSNRNDYTGNDTTATYGYTSRVFLEGDLTIVVRNTTTDVESSLSLTTDYTVTGVGDAAGGTIVLVDSGQAWISSSSFLDTGYVLTIRRVVPLTQGTDIRNQGDFFPEVHEDVFDRQVMISQQQQEELDRSSKLPESVPASSFSAELPADIVGEANITIMTNAAGNAFEAGPTSAAIAAAEATVASATGSAAAAATSAAAAATSAAASQWTDVVYVTSGDSPVAIVDANSGKLYSCNCAGGSIVFNLPAISGLSLSDPWSIGIKKSESSANTVTVNRNGSDTIDGATSVVVSRAEAGIVLLPDASPSPDDWTSLTFGEVPITGAIVGDTDTQALTNKDYDGGTASNASRLTVPKAAKSALDALTRKEGTIVYASDSNKLYADDGSILRSVGTPAFVFSTQSGDYTILDTDEFSTIAFDDTSSDRTCTLPTASANTNRMIVIKNVSTDKGKVTVDGEGAETIDTEFTSIDLDFEGAYIQVHCDGTGWFIVSENVTAARKQYALTVTGTGWTTVRAVGIPYRTLDGAWRVRFNISGSVISGVRVGYTVNVGGVVFKATSLYDQPVAGWVNGSFINMDVYAAQGTDDLVLNHTSGTTTKYNWAGDVECDSKPTFVE